MGLNIRILSGKRKGEEFKLKAGITIGRKSADLLIRDSKMSSLHAAVVEKEGQLYLVDQGSRNKISTSTGAVDELHLEDGASFTLGDTEFEIFYVQTGDVWEEKLSDYLKQIEKGAKNRAQEIHSFGSLVNLEVISGPDRGKKFVLGYGPRKAGKESLDLPLQEHFEKSELFCVLEKKKRLLLNSKYPDLLSINQKSIAAEEEIHDGDLISFGKTQIRVVIEK